MIRHKYFVFDAREGFFARAPFNQHVSQEGRSDSLYLDLLLGYLFMIPQLYVYLSVCIGR